MEKNNQKGLENKQVRRIRSKAEIQERKKIRFAKRVRAFLIVCLTLVCIVTLISFANSPKTKKDRFADFEQVEVTVYQGDKAWSIQRSLTPNANIDIREILVHLETLNGIESMGNIQQGETYIFLKEAN